MESGETGLVYMDSNTPTVYLIVNKTIFPITVKTPKGHYSAIKVYTRLHNAYCLIPIIAYS